MGQRKFCYSAGTVAKRKLESMATAPSFVASIPNSHFHGHDYPAEMNSPPPGKSSSPPPPQEQNPLFQVFPGSETSSIEGCDHCDQSFALKTASVHASAATSGAPPPTTSSSATTHQEDASKPSSQHSSSPTTIASVETPVSTPEEGGQRGRGYL